MTELLFLAIGVIAGAVAVPMFPPLFRLAERIRGWLKFTPKA